MTSYASIKNPYIDSRLGNFQEPCDCSDQIHTDGKNQRVFYENKDLSRFAGDREIYLSATKSWKARWKLEEYVKENACITYKRGYAIPSGFIGGGSPLPSWCIKSTPIKRESLSNIIGI